MTVRKIITIIEVVFIFYYLLFFVPLVLSKASDKPYGVLKVTGVGLAVFAAWSLIRYFIRRRNEKISQALYRTYREALAAEDKQAALEAGRDYYRFERGGKLTSADEQALANDLAVS